MFTVWNGAVAPSMYTSRVYWLTAEPPPGKVVLWSGDGKNSTSRGSVTVWAHPGEPLAARAVRASVTALSHLAHLAARGERDRVRQSVR
jgi:hypothetical protein